MKKRIKEAGAIVAMEVFAMSRSRNQPRLTIIPVKIRHASFPPDDTQNAQLPKERHADERQDYTCGCYEKPEAGWHRRRRGLQRAIRSLHRLQTPDLTAISSDN